VIIWSQEQDKMQRCNRVLENEEQNARDNVRDEWHLLDGTKEKAKQKRN
jgi:hypothetical protein